MAKLKNILPLVKKSFPKEVKVPSLAESASKTDKDNLSYVLDDAEAIWGGDCVGGISYFGKSADMTSIHEQTKIYLSKVKDVENHSYLFWDLGDYSIITLYEDYEENEDNPYPLKDNVLRILFGAWSDDDSLIDVLENKDYINEIHHWSYGSKSVDLKDKEHSKLLEEMKKAILSIDRRNED